MATKTAAREASNAAKASSAQPASAEAAERPKSEKAAAAAAKRTKPPAFRFLKGGVKGRWKGGVKGADVLAVAMRQPSFREEFFPLHQAPENQGHARAAEEVTYAEALARAAEAAAVEERPDKN